MCLSGTSFASNITQTQIPKGFNRKQGSKLHDEHSMAVYHSLTGMLRKHLTAGVAGPNKQVVEEFEAQAAELEGSAGNFPASKANDIRRLARIAYLIKTGKVPPLNMSPPSQHFPLVDKSSPPI